VASGWRLAIQGKLTMSIMNSKVAMKSVLMMGAAAGLMMTAGGARAQSGGYTFTALWSKCPRNVLGHVTLR